MTNAVLTRQAPKTLDAAGYQHVSISQSEREQLRTLKDERTWLDALWRQPATVVSPVDKVLIPILRRHLTKQASKRPALDYPVFLIELATPAGISTDTVSDRLKYYETRLGIIERRYAPYITASGKRGKQLYIKPLPVIDKPTAYAPTELRNHGGKRIACQKCRGTNVQVSTIHECRDCGHVTVNRLQDYETDDAAAAEPDEIPTVTNRQLACVGNNQQETGERVAALAALEPESGGGVLAHAETSALLDETINRQLACRWLAQLAGAGSVTEQQRIKTAKYLPAGDTFTLAMASEHLDGTHTYATPLWHADGQALAVCVESDDAAGTRVLTAAIPQLVETGAYAFVEYSPSVQHKGGGALWLVFAEPVNAAAAYATLIHHTPQLAAFVEYWPNTKRGRRLPFGRYVRPKLDADGDTLAIPAVDAWCDVLFKDGETLTGLNAANRAARDEHTPAAWVTEPAPAVETVTKADSANVSPLLVISTERVPLATATRQRPAALDDTAWLAKYGADAGTRWFAFVETFAAAWFNQRHTVAAILDADAKGYARAVWRGERSASVRVYANGSWRDYGKHGDWPAHGDALDAYCLVHGVDKAAVLADVARDIIQQAKAALTAAAAAKDGQVPVWLLDILTPAGWRYFDDMQNKAKAQRPIPAFGASRRK